MDREIQKQYSNLSSRHYFAVLSSGKGQFMKTLQGVFVSVAVGYVVAQVILAFLF